MKVLIFSAAAAAVLLVTLRMPMPISADASPAEASTGLEERLAEGYAHFEDKRLKDALAIFEEAAESWPDSAEALQAVGITCYRLDLYEKGAEALEKLVRLVPTSAAAYSRLGFIYSQMNRQMDALEAHSSAIALDPALASAHWGKGLAYKQLGHYEEAAKSFREVIRLRPEFAEAHYDLAETCLAMQDRCTALEEYRILHQLDKELAGRLFERIFIDVSR